MFAAHGLSLEGPLDEGVLLETPLPIDRSRPGFSEISTEAKYAIAPGDPALSLIYHALACPDVHPAPLAGSASGEDQYPTLEELDLVENYIWSLNRFSLEGLDDLEPQILAYQYRPAARTGHGSHADLVFSRTVITRFGDQPALYDPRMRCFRPDASGAGSVRVMPGRVGVFLTRMPGRGQGVAVMSRRGRRRVPAPAAVAHKLFDGPGCLVGRNLRVEFETAHTNRKLAKAFTVRRGLSNTNGDGGRYDLDQFPFSRICRNGSQLADPASCGSSLVVGVKPEPLIDLAVQDGRVVTVIVPSRSVPGLINRRYTSLRLSDSLGDLAQEGAAVILRQAVGAQATPPYDYSRPRNAPEFVNIRHTVDAWDPATHTTGISDMRQVPEHRAAFLEAVAAGGRRSVLFRDGCAEGLVAATVDGVELPDVKPAYSIVAPPDFFPFASQYEIHRWVQRERAASNSRYFRQGAPDPLCFGDLPPSPDIRDGAGRQAFDRSDRGLVQVFSPAPRGVALSDDPISGTALATYMTDAATNIFAPGWDVTYGGSPEAGYHYTTEGLGSPFPEDVKLCAAANAMWPAVSPDASRTFGLQETPTAVPMLDKELGIHPDHPLAAQGSFRGWDGEYGPFLTPDGKVNFADIERSDYVANLRDGLWRFDLLGKVDAAEIVSRMSALQRAVAETEKPGRGRRGRAEFSRLWLISAVARDWDRTQGDRGLSGKGYGFVFATADSSEAEQACPGRLQAPVQGEVVLVMVDASRVVAEREADARKAARFYAL